MYQTIEVRSLRITYRHRDYNRIKVGSITWKGADEFVIPARYDDCSGQEWAELLAHIITNDILPDEFFEST